MQQQQQVEMDVDAVTAVETAEAQEEEYLLGAKGASALRQLLSKSGNPAAVIAQFQSQHVVKAVHIDPMLQYFDLMGITRLEVHTQIMQALREKLAGKIPTLAMAVVEVLLQKSFRYIAIEELRLIPVALLMRFDKIPNLYLEQLAGNLELVTQLPIAIKRQVWEFSPPVFKAHIKVLFDEYVNDAEKWKVYAEVFTRATDLVDILGTISSAYGSETKAKAKNRRDVDHVLKKLLEFIGSSKILYYSAVELIRDLFGQTSNVLYALLRMEILMSFHDEGNREITESDVCYKYAWCLDACIHANAIDQRLTEELRSLYSKIKDTYRDQDHAIVSDFAMITAHPLFINLLLNQIIKSLNDVIEAEDIPRESEDLKFLSALLTLACSAHRIVREAKARVPKAAITLFKVFFPVFAEIMLFAEVKGEFDNEDLTNQLEEPFLQDKANVIQSIYSYYILERVRAHDIQRVSQLIVLMQKIEISHSLKPDPLSWLHRFLHSLVDELIHPDMREYVLTDSRPSPLLEVCVNKCFLPLARKSAVAHLEFLRLIAHLSIQMNDSPTENVLLRQSLSLPTSTLASSKSKLLMIEAAQECILEMGRTGAAPITPSSSEDADSISSFGQYIESEIKHINEVFQGHINSISSA